MTAAVLFCSAQAQDAAAFGLAGNKYDVTIHCNSNVGDYCVRDKNITETFTFHDTAFYLNFGDCKNALPITPVEILPDQSKYSINGPTFDAAYSTCPKCPENSAWNSTLEYCVCNEGLIPENGQCVALACPIAPFVSGTYPNCSFCPPQSGCVCAPGFCGKYPDCYACKDVCPEGYCGTRDNCYPCPVIAPNSLYGFQIKNAFNLCDLFIFGEMTIKNENNIFNFGNIDILANVDLPDYSLETGKAFFWGIKK
jgi:hypothetical protein